MKINRLINDLYLNEEDLNNIYSSAIPLHESHRRYLNSIDEKDKLHSITSFLTGMYSKKGIIPIYEVVSEGHEDGTLSIRHQPVSKEKLFKLVHENLYGIEKWLFFWISDIHFPMRYNSADFFETRQGQILVEKLTPSFYKLDRNLHKLLHYYSDLLINSKKRTE